MKRVIAACAAMAVICPSVPAHAFCGFYVSGSNTKLFNDATNVVLMRSGTRTVLAMQNDYRGPLAEFAMVVPVPVVLKPTDVKVVPRAAFDRIDSLSSPRLVEYWEQDPCLETSIGFDDTNVYGGLLGTADGESGGSFGYGRSGTGAGYGAGGTRSERAAVAPVLASFAMSPATVTAGVATDLTFTYTFANQPWPPPRCAVDQGVGTVGAGVTRAVSIGESTLFTLTCTNSAGASTKNFKVNAVKIEAQFDVEEYRIVILSAKEAAGLHDWLKLNGYKIPDGAEPLLRPYVEAGSKFFVAKVDPKKVKIVGGRAALSPLRFHYDSDEFSLPIRLGMANSSGKQDLIVNIVSPDRRYEVANYKNVTIPTNIDVLPAVKGRFAELYAALFDKTVEANPGAVVTEYAWMSSPGRGPKCDPCPTEIPDDRDLVALGADVIRGNVAKGGMVLTRLHARYGATDMKDDLRFVEAKAIAGGREVATGGGLERGATPSSVNQFQARYAIRHKWTGPVRCAKPVRDVWGGPPTGTHQTIAARGVAFAPRGALKLDAMLGGDVPELNLKRATTPAVTSPPSTKKAWLLGLGVLLGLGLLGAQRRRSA